MAKEQTFGKDARTKLAAGADKVAKPVAVTLGPGGRLVSLDRPFGPPDVTKDGVTVARNVTPLEDRVENQGASFLQEAAIETNNAAGDGTTTATLLAHSMYNAGLEAMEGKNLNPVYLSRGIRQAADFVIGELDGLTKKVKKAELYNVALISANHNTEIAEKLNKAINGGTDKPKEGEGEPVKHPGVGPDGMITVKEGRTHETTVEFMEGYEFENGYEHMVFITEPERMVAEIENAYVVLYDGKLTQGKEVVKILEAIPEGERNVVFIADDIVGEAMATLVLNRLNGQIQPVAVKAPGFGDRRKAMLDDIAIATGGIAISVEKGNSIEETSKEDLKVMYGRAGYVRVTKDKTILLDSAGEQAEIDSRLKTLKKQVGSASSDHEREKLEERLARLAGKVAVIHVGAFTEAEMKAKKYSVEDALNAVRAASAEGIVAGGGVAYLQLGKMLDAYIKKQKKLNPSVKEGMEIVAKALRQPLYMIAYNAFGGGVEEEGESAEALEAAGVLEKVSASESPSFGYDALNHVYCDDMLDKDVGIIDPALVVRSAIGNAASVAINLLNIECAVTINPEDDGAPGMGMPGMPRM